MMLIVDSETSTAFQVRLLGCSGIYDKTERNTNIKGILTP